MSRFDLPLPDALSSVPPLWATVLVGSIPVARAAASNSRRQSHSRTNADGGGVVGRGGGEHPRVTSNAAAAGEPKKVLRPIRALRLTGLLTNLLNRASSNT